MFHSKSFCDGKSVSDLRGMCKDLNIPKFSGKSKRWLINHCCAEKGDLPIRDLQQMCQHYNLPGYTKWDKDRLVTECVSASNCYRKPTDQLNALCKSKNVPGYGKMTKQEKIDWCCMNLDFTFGNMSVGDIKKYLKANDIKGYSSLNKDDLVKKGVAVEECRRKGTVDLRKLCKKKGVKNFSRLNKMQMVDECCDYDPYRGLSLMEKMSRMYPGTGKKKSPKAPPPPPPPPPPKEEHDLWMTEERDYSHRGGGKLYTYKGEINGKKFTAYQTYGHFPDMGIEKGYDKLTESEREAIYDEMEEYG